MGLGIREWLILAGVVLVLAVMVDGFRRMRSERRNSIKMSIGIGGGFPDDVEPFDTELPNGGARVIKRCEPQIAEFAMDAMDFDEDEHSVTLPSADAAGDKKAVPVEDKIGSTVTRRKRQSAEAYSFDERQIIVLHVKAKEGAGFNGNDLLQILLACDLRYAETKVLQRYEKSGGNGACQFSVANMIEPGVFDIDSMGSFSTPGVTFFMTIPGPNDIVQAFDCMLETAQCLAANLNGELLNEEHDALSVQELDKLRTQLEQRARNIADSTSFVREADGV